MSKCSREPPCDQDFSTRSWPRSRDPTSFDRSRKGAGRSSGGLSRLCDLSPSCRSALPLAPAPPMKLELVAHADDWASACGRKTGREKHAKSKGATRVRRRSRRARPRHPGIHIGAYNHFRRYTQYFRTQDSRVLISNKNISKSYSRPLGTTY